MADHYEADGQLDSIDGHPVAKEVVAEITRLTLYADAQQKRVGQLEAKVSELQTTLDSRIAIERASGMLAERFDIPINEAFDLLRAAARDSRRQLHALADEVIVSRGSTPDEIVDGRRRRDT